jgi:hypothetical protein
VNSVVAGPILEIGLGFVLRFLGFLCTYRVLLNSIKQNYTHLILGEELMALQESVFRVYSFPFYFIMKMFNIKLMCN